MFADPTDIGLASLTVYEGVSIYNCGAMLPSIRNMINFQGQWAGHVVMHLDSGVENDYSGYDQLFKDAANAPFIKGIYESIRDNLAISLPTTSGMESLPVSVVCVSPDQSAPFLRRFQTWCYGSPEHHPPALWLPGTQFVALCLSHFRYVKLSPAKDDCPAPVPNPLWGFALVRNLQSAVLSQLAALYIGEAGVHHPVTALPFSSMELADQARQNPNNYAFYAASKGAPHR